MKIVIVGDGKVGYTLTEQLSKEGHDIVVIDNNKDVLERSVEMLDVMVMQGNGASLKVQEAADVGQSDLLIAATSADEINLLCCIIARKLGCRHTIARVRNPEYAEQLYFLKEELGLSMTINPESVAAREIFRLLQLPSFLKLDAFAKGRVEIVEILPKAGGVLDGKRLVDLYKVLKIKVLVCAVEREGTVYIPDGNFMLQRNDKVYVTASAQDLASLVKALGLSTVKVRDVMIIGGSRIAYYLSTMLIAAGIRVKILDNRPESCRQMAELLPRAEVVLADGSSKKTLLAEGIEHADAVITLTNIDEENLLISMYANYMKVPKVITKINRTEYTEVIRDKGIDCVISPKQLISNDIVRYVRAMQNTTGGGVIALHRLVDDQVEALEFRATENTWHLGQTLTEITLKPNILIACINRGGKIIIPKGSDTLELGDTVIVVTTADRMFDDLNDIFDDSPEMLDAYNPYSTL